MKLTNRTLFQKKYIAFLAVVPLLLVTGLVKVECPVCGGNGYVSSGINMENVVIIKTEGHQKYVSSDMNICGMFVMYFYDVKLSCVNKGEEDAKGYVKLSLIDLKQGKVVDNQYVTLEVPAGTSLDVSFVVWFKSNEDLRLLRDEVRGEVVVDDLPCSICNGEGRLTLNSWFVAIALKDKFRELERESAQYTPPLEFNPATEQWVY